MDRPAVTFGSELRRWRRLRGLTQMQLALDAEVSGRHLSWLECDRSAPSRAMVLRLAERLDVPLRERNALLAAAGFAPLYAERALADPALGTARAALQRLLDAHEPWPALAVDRHWRMLACNRTVPMLLAAVAPALREPPVNVLRLTLHPDGLAPMIEGFPAWRGHVLARLMRQARQTGDPELHRLHAELAALRMPAGAAAAGPPIEDHAVIVPLVLASPVGRLAFLSTVTVFGAPHDVLLSELAVETLLPADAATAEALRGLLSTAELSP